MTPIRPGPLSTARCRSSRASSASPGRCVVAETIPEALALAAASYGDRVWIRTDNGTATFATAVGRVAEAARRLRAAGVEPGDRVLLTTRTTPAYLHAWLATTCTGAIAVPTNPAATPAELAGLLTQTRPRLVVTDADLADTADEARSQAAVDADLVDVAEMVGDWRVPVLQAQPVPDDVGPGDVASLIPTSGTTGRSKLVMQTHRAYAWAGDGFPWWMELAADDVLMTSLPLFHVNAPAYSVMGSLTWARVSCCSLSSRRAAFWTLPGATERPSSTPSARCS